VAVVALCALANYRRNRQRFWKTVYTFNDYKKF